MSISTPHPSTLLPPPTFITREGRVAYRRYLPDIERRRSRRLQRVPSPTVEPDLHPEWKGIKRKHVEPPATEGPNDQSQRAVKKECLDEWDVFSTPRALVPSQIVAVPSLQERFTARMIAETVRMNATSKPAPKLPTPRLAPKDQDIPRRHSRRLAAISTTASKDTSPVLTSSRPKVGQKKKNLPTTARRVISFQTVQATLAKKVLRGAINSQLGRYVQHNGTIPGMPRDYHYSLGCWLPC